MHPSTQALLRFFDHGHLPARLAAIAGPCADLADQMATELEDTENGAELTTGLRKLLEAKDCFVRAALPAADGRDER